MIHGQLAYEGLVPAILAGVMIPKEYIVAIEANHVFSAFERYELDQAKNPGNWNAY